MDEEQEEKDLRVWVAGRLDLEELPEVVWKVLSHRGYIQAVVGGEISRSVLAERAQTLIPYGEVLESAAHEPEANEEQSLEHPVADDNEIQRSKVVAEYLALRMAMQPQVYIFRDILETFLEESDQEPQQAIRDLQEEPQAWRDHIGSHSTETERTPVTLLERLVSRIVNEVAGYWTQEEAIEFVLADKVSFRQPVQIDSQEESPDEQGAINLRVEPWVSTQTLVSFFQYERNRKLGRRPRAIAARNLEVARFVFLAMRVTWYRQLLPHAKFLEINKGLWYEEILRNYSWLERYETQGAPSWQGLVDLWNRHYPEQQYEGTRRFYTDFHRGVRAIVPPYSISQTEGGA